MNLTRFIESAQPEGDGEGSGHLETVVKGEIHVFLPLYGCSFADLD